MNLVLFESSELHGDGTVVLEGRRAQHIRDVHRAEAGTALRVGCINGRIGAGRVVEVSADRVMLSIESLDAEPPPPLPLTLVLALPRPKVINRVFAAVASMGIKRIDVINAWRVEKSYWKTPRLAEDHIRAQLLLGLEQSGDSLLPEVRLHRFFRHWAENELVELARESTVLVAHPRARNPLSVPTGHRSTLLVGPEGGFTDEELSTLEDRGAIAFSAGPRVLRVETAIPWLVATVLRGG